MSCISQLDGWFANLTRRAKLDWVARRFALLRAFGDAIRNVTLTALLERYFVSDNHYNLALQEQAGRNILRPQRRGYNETYKNVEKTTLASNALG